MLCEISLANGNFFLTWAILTLIGWFLLIALSATLFIRYYQNPTYQDWRYKSNPKYPEPAMVREEITTMTKGLLAATLCPALSLYLAQRGYSKAYCGTPHGIGYEIFCFFVIWIGSDFFEFFYHWSGHSSNMLWSVHKAHHHFYNPSPFAVIADEYLDQFVRASPLLLFPLIMPINTDLMFFEFALFFYGYGVYLHWGYEMEFPDAHHPWINTSYQHYLHHAKSIKLKPYHTGFFFKFWDKLFGSIYTGKCDCAKCARERGERTKEQWDKLERPDYSILLTPSFWLSK